MSGAASGVLEGVRFGDRGLVTAVVQDWKTGEVLMVAHMNAEALAKTVETGVAHYWSRSRGKLWLKGETSGHVQRVKGVYLDCDGDAVLLRVSQKRGACHLGYRSCYFRKWSRGKWREVAERVFAPEDVYSTPKNQ